MSVASNLGQGSGRRRRSTPKTCGPGGFPGLRLWSTEFRVKGGYIGVILGLHWRYMGLYRMPNLGVRVWGLGF